MIKNEIGSVDDFGREAQEQCLVFCVQIRLGGKQGLKFK